MSRDVDRLRREVRPWRLLFVVYLPALTVGTHWPALGLGTESQPAPDKLLHMLAFGVLTLLLSRTRWMGSPWLAGLAVLLWTGLDELTQGMGVLRRISTYQDMLAGMLGVCLVTVWLWALGPLGGRANRVRLRWRAFIFADLFCRHDVWLAVGATAGGGGALVGATTWLGASGTRHALTIVFLSATVAAMSFAGAVAALLYNRHARRLSLQRPCFACGRSSVGAGVPSVRGPFIADSGANRSTSGWRPRSCVRWLLPRWRRGSPIGLSWRSSAASGSRGVWSGGTTPWREIFNWPSISRAWG